MLLENTLHGVSMDFIIHSTQANVCLLVCHELLSLYSVNAAGADVTTSSSSVSHFDVLGMTNCRLEFEESRVWGTISETSWSLSTEEVAIS